MNPVREPRRLWRDHHPTDGQEREPPMEGRKQATGTKNHIAGEKKEIAGVGANVRAIFSVRHVAPAAGPGLTAPDRRPDRRRIARPTAAVPNTRANRVRPHSRRCFSRCWQMTSARGSQLAVYRRRFERSIRASCGLYNAEKPFVRIRRQLCVLSFFDTATIMSNTWPIRGAVGA
jgi:hypothetical protein